MTDEELAVRRMRLNLGNMLVDIAHMMYELRDEKLLPDGLAVLSIGLRIQGDALEGVDEQRLVETSDFAKMAVATTEVQ